eukprot:CAMPEP_0174332462 /NCGR_PEP_ID=MMETSP0810-20121108/18319_1 /TAXON_ID=73025 ORGANISM="Eutreptiella gymnastica-like, Strain CCMP1594" /NCGR_SAMPLE_ID=MMETSP0810 /ASSEMBLY_ACC=CAM_ASM_000659 /LENGTH=125 /DNA_ID=CAMNT_0015448889 /DNA_START=278 /DNA_END=656 /DNA_ORIENTATION=+
MCLVREFLERNVTNSTTVKSRKHKDVKGVGEKKLGDPFKTASEKFHRRQAQMKQPVAEACSDQRDDHPTDDGVYVRASAPLPVQAQASCSSDASTNVQASAMGIESGRSSPARTARDFKAKQHCA